MTHLFAITPTELAERIGPGRAKRVYRALREGAAPAPKDVAAFDVALPPVTTETVSRDGTTKLLLTLPDGAAIETVLIPQTDRTTVCISTQVGCRRGCTFCLTATMGLLRNLTPDEIVAQVYLARMRGPVRNVVFMGMGEPLDNPASTRVALDVLIDGLAVGPRHITVSTVAPSPKAVARVRDWPGRIAWSLHTANDEVRRRLIPTARHSVAALRDAFAALDRSLFVEITLIDGINDRPEDAEAIARLFEGFPSEVRLNLLPMNPIGVADMRPSSAGAAFRARLQAAGHFCSERRPRGVDARAACGQLAVSRA